MTVGKKDKEKRTLVGLIAGVAAVMVLAGIFVVVLLGMDDSGKRKRQVQMVTLMKPPPPPPPKVEPPPPEKIEEVIKEPEPEEAPEETADDLDEPPPGELLGLDADGGAGSDSFGLLAKKGGRSLLGGNDRDALLRKYAWYTRILRDELERLVRRYLENNRGIPKGELEAIIRVKLDEAGNITSFRIVSSSGNPEMDEAVQQTLKLATVNEPPPKDMPRVVKLKIVSKG